ncbi:sigma-54-dependent Fis family transcriptional regulator [Solicola sp. PLA-1-18]|uniref:sigma-54-dependent Fis family transcriptional regulator n=1 Tax=Solicola sp. PLA-1-18 TaxID=3380532 RepID=UPI003B7EF84C
MLDLPDARGVRPDIAQSWHRVALSGLDPAGAFDRLVPAEVDLQSSLVRGAAPVLDELEASLQGTGYLTVLVDRDCRIVRRWFDDADARESFDGLNIVLGANLDEDAIGTSALGTVMETRHGMVVNGPEHFVEPLRGFSCYGHPVRHPLTRRIEGVLDISSVVDRASPLLPPLIERAAHDVEQRLLEGSRTSEKNLLWAFQAASRQRRRAVVAIGEDLVLSNRTASDLLGPSDLALLRALAEDPCHADRSSLDLTLESGEAVAVEVLRVGGARDGLLLSIDLRDASRRVPLPSPPVSSSAPVLVAGAPGTGRTTRATELACRQPVTVLTAADALVRGPTAWAADLDAAVRRGVGTVCVDGVDLLPDALVDLVGTAVDRPGRPALVLTSGPVDGLTGRAAALAGVATTREELLPLSARRQDVPELAATILRRVATCSSVHLTPGAVGALAAQPWPGNLRELEAVLVHAASQRSTGGLTVDDLPEQYRTARPTEPMAPLEQAERDVIVTALRAADGNKARAARALGVSRTTLYARMRGLRITTY